MDHQGQWMISRHFDAQLEAYLLSKKWDRVDSTLTQGEIQYHEAKVIIRGEEVEQEWLTVTGVVADALTDGQEVIHTWYKKVDGSFQDAEILQVKKQNLINLQRTSGDFGETQR